jgi:hypothetical protein
MERSVKETMTMYEREAVKIPASSPRGAEAPTGDNGRGVGQRPKLSIKERRLAEEAADKTNGKATAKTNGKAAPKAKAPVRKPAKRKAAKRKPRTTKPKT